MAHVRATIRDAIVTMIEASSLVSTVRASHSYPLNSDKSYPATFVYAMDEQGETVTMSAGTKHRQLSVAIEHHLTATASLADDALDAASVIIEKTMQSADFSALLKSSDLVRTEIAFESDGNLPLGMIRLTYAVEYGTQVDNPEIAR